MTTPSGHGRVVLNRKKPSIKKKGANIFEGKERIGNPTKKKKKTKHRLGENHPRTPLVPKFGGRRSRFQTLIFTKD